MAGGSPGLRCGTSWPKRRVNCPLHPTGYTSIYNPMNFLCCMYSIVFFYNSFIAAASAFRAGYVIGGEDAEITDWPFMVSLQLQSFGHFCGGVLYDSSHVVTAGHCVWWKQPVSIINQFWANRKRQNVLWKYKNPLLISSRLQHTPSITLVIAVGELHILDCSPSLAPPPSPNQKLDCSWWASDSELHAFTSYPTHHFYLTHHSYSTHP